MNGTNVSSSADALMVDYAIVQISIPESFLRKAKKTPWGLPREKFSPEKRKCLKATNSCLLF